MTPSKLDGSIFFIDLLSRPSLSNCGAVLAPRSGALRSRAAPFDRFQDRDNGESRLGSIRKTAGQDRAGNEFNQIGLRQCFKPSHGLIDFVQGKQQSGGPAVGDVNS